MGDLPWLYYAGIGSRDTPEIMRIYFKRFVELAEDLDFILRSGHAPGADKFFEEFIRDPRRKEIYLPWEGFEGSNSKLFTPSAEAFRIAEQFHPYWHNLSAGAKKLQARNTHQVLGEDCNTPSSLVICWTEGGKYKGGTSQAMRIADAYNIPIFNLGEEHPDDILNEAIRYIESL